MNRREAESDTTENISLISRYGMLMLEIGWSGNKYVELTMVKSTMFSLLK